MKRKILSTSAVIMTVLASFGGVVNVGKASYSDTFPGVDKANRNSYPSGSPYVSGKAALSPVPTNDWWSNELTAPFGHSIFNYPLALKSGATGLTIINNLFNQAITADKPLTVGLEGLSTDAATVCDYSDWTVTLSWKSQAAGEMKATIGMGMPFVYFSKNSDNAVRIDASIGKTDIKDNMLLISGSYNGASYIVYAPSGSQWIKNGSSYTNTLDDKNYWSVVMLPKASDPSLFADRLAPYAFVFPGDTRVEMRYDASEGKVTNRFIVTPDVKEGKSDKVLLGLLPHHISNLEGDAGEFMGLEYDIVRGKLRMCATNSFSTSMLFHGLLPYLPLPADETFSAEEMKRLVKAVCDDNGFDDWTDSYNDGQLLHRLVQTGEAAKSAGDEEGFNIAFKLVKNQLERWMTYKDGDIAFMFYYHEPWQSMLGYPAGHGQDSNLNDHNFHWGYFIRAAAFIAQYDQQWVKDYGEFINMLVRDVASYDRNDEMFPYLRAYSPYAGHCWANGTASLSLGNDQESTSEAMQFNTALILWGDVTGNMEMRDLGVCLYASEYAAIREYWFDVNGTNLVPSFSSALASRVFGNSYDNENFWGGGIAGSYGIQIYPMNSGSFYLMNDPEYASVLWKAMSSETGILVNDSNPNIWYDTWIRFLAMQDADQAINLYNNSLHLGEKFGESQAYTYQWINALRKLGNADMSITANHPLAMAFDNDGLRTYIARNNSDSPIKVIFSDGYTLNVAPGSMEYKQEGLQSPKVTVILPEGRINVGTAYVLSAKIFLPETFDGKPQGVEFFVDDNSIGKASLQDNLYVLTWTPDEAGTHIITAVMTDENDQKYNSRVAEVQVRNAVEPDILSCTFISSDASEGSFNGDYTITCTTVEGGVEIKASFAGDYVGFVGPYLFDETNGFREILMNEAAKGIYTYSLPGIKEGDRIRFRVKIAYAGGLGITTQREYIAGSYCEGSSVDGIIYGVVATAYPNPTSNGWNITGVETGTLLTLWSADGKNLMTCKANNESNIFYLDGTSLPAGIYLLNIASATSTQTLRLIRK